MPTKSPAGQTRNKLLIIKGKLKTTNKQKREGLKKQKRKKPTSLA
jgi:hypothetical protein